MADGWEEGEEAVASPSTPLPTPGKPTRGQRQFKGRLGYSHPPRITAPIAPHSQCPVCFWRMDPDRDAFPAPGARCAASLRSQAVTTQGAWGRWWASDSHPEGASGSHSTGSLSGGLDQLGWKGRQQ